MADQRIQYTEEEVGAGHPTKADTLNRLGLVEHGNDGTHNTGIHRALAFVWDEKADNTDAPTFTTGAWRTRELNTKNDPEGIVSLASNQMTLEPGEYAIEASAPVWKVAGHQVRLYNITAAALIAQGSSSIQNTTVEATTRSFVQARFTLTVQSVIELQHYCQTTTGSGMGISTASITVGVEVYAQVKITKL